MKAHTIVMVMFLVILGGFVYVDFAEAETRNKHAIGLTFVSGISDVSDFIEDQGYDVTSIPVGLSYAYVMNFNSGLRIDAGLGPITWMSGDADYYDFPIRVTAGYSLSLDGFTPYAKGGFACHFAGGDYVSDSTGFGLIGAVGFEYELKSRFSIFTEASYDTTELNFEGRRDEDVKVHAFMLTVGLMF